MNIVITGASRGLGKGFVLSFLENHPDAKIVAISQNPEKLSELSARFKGRLFIRKPFQAGDTGLGSEAPFQNIDLLINNAGIFIQDQGFAQLQYQDIEASMRVNVGIALNTTQTCLSALKQSKAPKVIFVSSLMGSISDNTSGGSYTYRMAKAALNMMVKCFSIEEKKITSIVIHPGWVKTDMGGASAPLSIEESISGMINVISKLTAKDSGKFFDFEGDTLPW